jgi:hypothetical protein
MTSVSFTIKAKVWIYPGKSGWHFVTIQSSVGDEIKKYESWPRRGFGSIEVIVKIKDTSWKTSIFPIKEGEYLLPIKKEIRKKENINSDDIIKVTLELKI